MEGLTLVRIERHEIDAGAVPGDIERLAVITGRLVEAVDFNPEALASVTDRSRWEAGLRTVLDPEGRDPGIQANLELATEASQGLFAAAGRDEGDGGVECVLRGVPHQVRAIGPQLYVDPWRWLESLWTAVIRGDRARVQALAAVPSEVLFYLAINFDQSVVQLVSAVRQFWRGEPGVEETATRAWELTHPDLPHTQDEEFLGRLVAPLTDTFLALVRGDAQEFDTRLAHAVAQHRLYWAAEVDDRARNPQGYVAWGPLALTCLAADLGHHARVSSGYLPQGLMRDWRPPGSDEWADWVRQDGRPVEWWTRRRTPEEREAAERWHPQDEDRISVETALQLRHARQRSVKADRAVGEYSSMKWLATQFPEDEHTVVPRHSGSTGWSRFDWVFEVRAKAGDDVRYVVLAPKGPEDPIIIRWAPDRRRYEQGHLQYLRALIAGMRATGGEADLRLAAELERAWADGNVEYHLVQTFVDDNGGYGGYLHTEFALR